MYSSKLIVTQFKLVCVCTVVLNCCIVSIECIFGGSRTPISRFPYQVSVRYGNKHHCGGSILDAYTILTASHCVHGHDYSLYSVRVGSSSLNHGHIFNVVEIIEHPEYQSSTYDNDIAVLKLDFPLTFSEDVEPISLQRPGEETPEKTVAFISGWGRMEGRIFPQDLHATFVHVITHRKCGSRHGKDKITTNMLCTFTRDQDACIGDSGGPLVVQKVQIGIISWGRECAHLRYPGVYTKVSKFYDWIQQNKHKKNNSVCPTNQNSNMEPETIYL